MCLQQSTVTCMDKMGTKQPQRMSTPEGSAVGFTLVGYKDTALQELTSRYLLGGREVDQGQDEHEEAVVRVRALHNGPALGRQNAPQDVGLGAFHLQACSTNAGFCTLLQLLRALQPLIWLYVYQERGILRGRIALHAG